MLYVLIFMQYVLSSVIVANMYNVNCQLNFVVIQMLRLHVVKICMDDSQSQTSSKFYGLVLLLGDMVLQFNVYRTMQY